MQETAEISDFKKAVYFLLNDQFDATDLELNSSDEIYIEYIISALIENNENTCPFKNYDCVRSCESYTDQCKKGLSINCKVELEKIWKKFMGI